MPKFLTFDLGTTLYKLALFDEQGRVLALHRVTPPIREPQAGRSELDPGEFKRVLIEALGKLRFVAGKDWDDIAACSFATQANSFTLLDPNDRPLAPLILWPDRRAAELADELRQVWNVGAMSGVPRLSIHLALAKHRWLQRHEPQIVLQSKTLCFISDYLTQWLTGKKFTEAAVAALSGLAFGSNLTWSDSVPRLFGIAPDSLLPMVRAGTDIGRIARQTRQTLGLPRACRFVVGTLDQYAGAIGTGTISAGSVCETTGTVLSAVQFDEERWPRPDVFHGPSFRKGFDFHMVFSSTSGNLLEWYRNLLPQPRPDFDELSRLASEANDAVMIEPHRNLEPLEHCFRHVQPDHSVGQIVRGIMRCVAGALKNQVDSIAGGVLPVEIRAAGGGARSDLWLQMKADLLGIPFVSLECEEPTSLGAAILAAHGIGMGSVEEIAGKWVRVRKRFTPGDALRS